jgi:hypothetical protein
MYLYLRVYTKSLPTIFKRTYMKFGAFRFYVRAIKAKTRGKEESIPIRFKKILFKKYITSNGSIYA